jgi:hypothetical protein
VGIAQVLSEVCKLFVNVKSPSPKKRVFGGMKVEGGGRV